MKFFFLFFFFLTFVIACHKEVENDVALAEIKQMKFTCIGVQDTIHFIGSINNSTYCLSKGYDQCYALTELGSKIVTSSPTFNTADTSIIRGRFLRFTYGLFIKDINYNRATTLTRPDIDITGPIIDKNLSLYTQCEKYLKKGSYPVRAFADSDTVGFNITLLFSYKSADNTGATRTTLFLDSSSGSQYNTDKITFDEVQKWDARGQYHYFVKGHVTCKLYRLLKLGEPGEYFYQVENAEFTHQFDVDK